MRAAPEIRALTGLRAFPALLVVVYHFHRDLFDAVPVVSAVIQHGFIAVGMFFVLSGFVLAYAYADVPLHEPLHRWRFFRARFARIYPVYFLSLVVTFVAELPASAKEAATWQGLRHIALVVPLLNAFSRYGMFYLNWAAWSLSAEAAYYLLFPWVSVWLRARSGRGLVAVGVCAWVFGLVAPTAYTLLDPDHLGKPLVGDEEVFWCWHLKFSPMTHVASFVIGVVAGELFVRRRDRRPEVPWKAGVVVVAAVVFLAMLLQDDVVPFAWLTTDVLAPVFAVVVGAVATIDGTRSIAARGLRSTGLLLLGRASYSVYILQVPVFYGFLHFLPQMWESERLFWAYFGVLIGVAIGVHAFVEEPARRRIAGRR